jgi:hypothetical protein
MVLAASALGAGIVASGAAAQPARVVDIPTRPGATQRFLYVPASEPKAAAILFAGGHGGLAIDASGAFGWGAGNFLVRSRALFAERGVAVAVVDAPSDRQAAPWLSGFRQSAAHAADVRALVAWLRNETKQRVWLVGTSAGTFSAAATALAGVGADGLVLTSTVVFDQRGGRPVSAMPLEKLTMPVLVVHHKEDGCPSTPYAQVPALVAKLSSASRSAFVAFEGGKDEGDPCEAFAHHGYPGLEPQVVDAIVKFMLAK